MEEIEDEMRMIAWRRRSYEYLRRKTKADR